MTATKHPGDLTEEQQRRLDRLLARSAAQTARRPGSDTEPVSGPSRKGRKRRHAAKGSRRAALALSLATTGALTAFFHAEALPQAGQVGTAPVAAIVAAAADTTVTGDAISTRFGPVQVQATFAADGTLASVDALLTPNGDGRSVRLNQAVVPVLNQEALTAQSAEVDTVSGATYTSVAYAASLQSAIDRAYDDGITQLQ